MSFHNKGEQEHGLVRNSTGTKSMLYATLFATENSTGIPQDLKLNGKYAQGYEKGQILWNFVILTSESHSGPKIKWKKYPICPKQPKLRYS